MLHGEWAKLDPPEALNTGGRAGAEHRSTLIAVPSKRGVSIMLGQALRPERHVVSARPGRARLQHSKMAQAVATTRRLAALGSRLNNSWLEQLVPGMSLCVRTRAAPFMSS